MSNDQPVGRTTPAFKTTGTPEFLRKLRPDQLVGERKAIEHFYNKFKIKAEESARHGESSFSLEITDAECGVSSDFDVQLVLREIHDLLKAEGFIIISKEISPSGDLATLEAGWKERSKPTQRQAAKEERQLSTVPLPGGYQMNPALMEQLSLNYQNFVASQNAAHQAKYQHGYFPSFPGTSFQGYDNPWGLWQTNGYAGYPPDGYSSPNPTGSPESQ